MYSCAHIGILYFIVNFPPTIFPVLVFRIGGGSLSLIAGEDLSLHKSGLSLLSAKAPVEYAKRWIIVKDAITIDILSREIKTLNSIILLASEN